MNNPYEADIILNALWHMSATALLAAGANLTLEQRKMIADNLPIGFEKQMRLMFANRMSMIDENERIAIKMFGMDVAAPEQFYAALNKIVGQMKRTLAPLAQDPSET